MGKEQGYRTRPSRKGLSRKPAAFCLWNTTHRLNLRDGHMEPQWTTGWFSSPMPPSHRYSGGAKQQTEAQFLHLVLAVHTIKRGGAAWPGRAGGGRAVPTHLCLLCSPFPRAHCPPHPRSDCSVLRLPFAVLFCKGGRGHGRGGCGRPRPGDRRGDRRRGAEHGEGEKKQSQYRRTNRRCSGGVFRGKRDH